MADEFNIPLAAAALQFPLGHQIITSVIPGPRNALELRQIVDWFKIPIPDEFWLALLERRLIEEHAPLP